MGKIRGPYKKAEIPSDFRGLLKMKTNWKKVVKSLLRIGFGGYEYQNYNGQKIVAEPKYEVLQWLTTYVWGKPPDFRPDDVDAKAQLAEFAKFTKQFVQPKSLHDVPDDSVSIMPDDSPKGE